MRIKTQKTFNKLKYLSNCYFFDSIAKSLILNPTKSLWWSLFANIVNEFYKWLYNYINYNFIVYSIIYNFINSSVFIDIEQTCI